MSKAPEDNPSPPAIPTSAGAGARSGADRMVRARRALTRGQADQARDLLLPLLRGPRSVAVEARALFAESYLIEGRYGDAVDGYRKVVRDFAGTPQAETALYAIAQLEVEASGREEAVQALRRYLARYPDGRFAREARERLERLASPAGR
jgi:TolA-binding protein